MEEGVLKETDFRLDHFPADYDKERIALEELEEVQPAVAWEQEKSLSVLLGMADIPQAQKQEAVSINLSKDGHILLYGSPGTGKTTFLQTAAMDLAR